MPVVLAKLWSVVPKLFVWPPVRSPAQALERPSLLLLVGGILFEIVTGLMNIQYDYVFGFSFYTAHYIGAWVFIGAFVAHVVLKLPHMVRGLRSRSLRAELRMPTRRDRARRSPTTTGWSPPTRPGRPTMSRRGALALVGGGSLLVATMTAGQTLGGPLRGLAVLLPRGRNTAAADGGPNDFPINQTFAVTGIDPVPSAPPGGSTYRRRRARPARPRRPGRAAAAHRDAADRLRGGLVDDPGLDRGAAARPRRPGRGAGAGARRWSRSLEDGPFGQATLTSGPGAPPGRAARAAGQRGAARPDHGYPARVVVPALPGVHSTKWVRSIEFRSA